MQRILLIVVFSLIAIISSNRRLDAFELCDGDRVIFLGNSFFERAIDYGHIETALTARWPERNITFRNLGWDGDTVYSHSRAGGRRRAVFGHAEEGFQRMVKHVHSLRPNVIFLAYGFNESFDGEAGLEKFRNGLKLLIEEVGSDETKFVLLSPLPIRPGFGLDEERVAERNAMIRRYADVVAEIAAMDRTFVDIFSSWSRLDGEKDGRRVLCDNGLHPNEFGYAVLASVICEKLKTPPPKITDTDQLRELIVKKNTLYFHRWRPRNDAFVYGERKDEQKIAQTEPEQFEPHIQRQEEAIRKLLSGGGKK